MSSTTLESNRYHSSRFPWTLQALEAMLDGLNVAKKRRLTTVDGSFKDPGWQLAVDAVQKLVPNRPVRKEYVVDKARACKDLWTQFKAFETGHERTGRWGFDEAVCTWIAADGAVADDYFAGHPEHQGFRHEGPGGPALFWRLERVLGDDSATGRYAASIDDILDLGSPFNRSERRRREARRRKRRVRAVEDVGGGLPGADGPVGSVESGPTSSSSMPSTSVGLSPPRKRARRGDSRERAVEDFLVLNQQPMASTEMLRRRATESAVTPIMTALKLVQDEFDTTDEALMYFCSIFENVEMARVFCRLDCREDRRLWLERQLALKPDGERIILEKASRGVVLGRS